MRSVFREEVVSQLLGLVVERINTESLVHSNLLFFVVLDHLHDKVWIRLMRELIETHVDIRITLDEVLVLFACKEAVVLPLVLDLERFFVP